MANFTFITKSGKTAVLTIGGATVSADCCLAAEPIITELKGDDDFFAPIRLQSGNINIIGNVSDLEAIMSDKPTDRPVTLTIDNTVVWKGFLQGGGYTQPWVAGPNEISIPIVSPLTLAESFFPSTDALGYISFVDFVNNMNTALGSPYTSIQFPDFCATSKTFLFLMKNYASFNEDTLKFDVKSYKDIFEDICKFFGWTAIEQGATLYICLLGYDEIYGQTFSIEGADHSIDYLVGKRKVSTIGMFNPIDESLFEFSTKKCCNSSTIPHIYDVSSKNFHAYSYKCTAKPELVTTYAYNSNGNQYTGTAVHDIKIDDCGSDQNYFGGTWNVNAITLSGEKESETHRFSIKKSLNSEHKKAIEFTCPIKAYNWYNDTAVYYDLDNNNNMTNYNVPVILLSFSAKVEYSDNGSDKFKTLDDGAVYLSVMATGKVNGSVQTKYAVYDPTQPTSGANAWDSVEHILACKVKNGKLKNFDLPNTDGFLFRVPTDMCKEGAKITVRIWTQKSDDDVKYISLSDVEIKCYKYKSAEYENQYLNQEENKVEHTIGNGFLEDLEVSSDITLADCFMNRFGQGCIVNSSGQPYGLILYRDSSNAAHEECNLINRLKAYYSKTRKKITATITANIQYLGPRRKYLIDGSKYYLCLGNKVNWRDETIKGQFFELP